ncbi:exonuclease SbcCD subunit D [Bacillus piscicola]|uniref:exonuclease SbcCD subunit D n=1 Tax=Bacillus piscicola TaxID=1632684 RepID=UPI001F08D95C|nr:exonuclease SbcCD subunit D [Bacillus piscicola]
MKFFHTADWHLGKLVQGVYMTEDQAYILQQFKRAVKEEKPDAVIIAGDLYDRAVPPTEAVQLLDKTLEEIVIDLKTPVLAIAGNHDSPSRLHFGSEVMKERGLHIAGRFTGDLEPIVLSDEYGEVHFHLIPYCDPSVVRSVFQEEDIRSHHDAAEKITERIHEKMDPHARHVFVGHAFVTPYGEEEANTSDSERPLAIGGTEHIDCRLFDCFHYTALGHLHQSHYVGKETIRYAGSILKYSISEEHHNKGFTIVELHKDGTITTEKRALMPRRDMRTVTGTLAELLEQSINEDYVFVRLEDKAPVLSPMEKIRSIYPNAMHVERKHFMLTPGENRTELSPERHKMSDVELFQAFYREVKGMKPDSETEAIFKEVLEELLHVEQEAEGQRVSETEMIKG